MGENGAGKSTLMNILTGIHKQDKGQIFVDGKEINFKNPLEAEAYGIAFIHQELNIWPNLSILENLFLMHSVTNGMGILDFKAMRALAEQKCREIEIELPLDMEAGECSVGQQQMTEIVRNLLLDAKVVIMDEPTAALTERETEKLFEVMRSLKKRGVAMVYISHRMEEVTQNCDIQMYGFVVDNQKIIRIFAAPKIGELNINKRFIIIYANNSTVSSQRTRGYRREE